MMTTYAALSGPIEEVMAELLRLPGTCRLTSGTVTVVISGPKYDRSWYLEPVTNGDAERAYRDLEDVRNQISQEQQDMASEALAVLAKEANRAA